MKRPISILILVFVSVLLFGQNDNPYSQFGYESPIMKEQAKVMKDLSFLKIYNTDTTSNIGWLEIDVEQSLVNLYSRQGQIIASDTLLKSSIARWFTTDPARQYHSPYNGMGNNPINCVDPNGALVDWFRNSETGATIWSPSEAASITIGNDVYTNIGKFYSMPIGNDMAVFYGNSRIPERFIDLNSDIGHFIRAVYTETQALDTYLGRKIIAEVINNRLLNNKEFKNDGTYLSIVEATRGKKYHQFQFMDNNQKNVYNDIISHSQDVDLYNTYDKGGNMLVAESIEVCLNVNTRKVLSEMAYYFYHAHGNPGGRTFSITVPSGTTITNLYGIKGN